MSPASPELKVIFLDIDDTLFGTTDFVQEARTKAVEAMIERGLKAEVAPVLQELAEVVAEFGSNDDHHYNRLLKRLPDAATAGAILEAARRAWRAPRLSAHWCAGTDDLPSPYAEPGWIVDLGDGENVVAGATDYVEALILAIEAAPDEQPASGSAAG